MFFERKLNQTLCLMMIGCALFILMISGCSDAVTLQGDFDTEADKVQKEKLHHLNETAESFYKKVTDGYIIEARNELISLGNQVTRIQFSGVTSVEGVEALSESIVSAKRIFNAARSNQEEGLVAAAKIRLAADALTHPNDPMWLQYYKVLQEDLSRMDQAAGQEAWQDVRSSFAVLQHHYFIIRPSLLISKQPFEVEKADSLFVFMKSQLAENKKEKAQSANVKSVISQFRIVIDVLFMKTHEQAYAPLYDQKQPFIWTAGIGSVIITVLGYVAWRKYKYEKGYVPVRRNPYGKGDE